MKLFSPKFYWHMPKDGTRYLSGKKSAYYAEHRIAYYMFSILALLLFFAPAIPYCLLLFTYTKITPEHFGPIGGLGMLGAMVFGLGLGNIVGAFIHEYLGHKVTLILFGIGILLMTWFFMAAL